MSGVPASSRSGGLPSQWTVDSGGNLLIVANDPGNFDGVAYLTGGNGRADFTPEFTVTNAQNDSLIVVDSSGETTMQAHDANAVPLIVRATDHGVQSRDLVQVINESGSGVFVVDREGRPTLLVHAAPADGLLLAGWCALWFDQTDGASALKIKAKTANGTVATATIPLT